jgi:hypothetical protein
MASNPSSLETVKLGMTDLEVSPGAELVEPADDL